MALQLVIGNKNYSSWSMRPWVLMKELGLPFEEHKLRLSFAADSPFHRAVAAVSPAGKVPILIDTHDGFAVWDTLAIVERLHDLFPDAGVWPKDSKARARARSIACEMHAGFGPLRSHCGMNIEADLREVGARVWAEQAEVRQNMQRIEAAWADALAGSGGPFLFGAFSAADAYFAPVCMRVLTYALPVSAASCAYVERVKALPAVAAWIGDALAEADFIVEDEPHRTQR